MTTQERRDAGRFRTTHALKTLRPHFEDVASGKKTFDVRLNDRDFREGDVLLLREWDTSRPIESRLTGRECNVLVTHVLGGGSFGISPDHVVMSVRRVEP